MANRLIMMSDATAGALNGTEARGATRTAALVELLTRTDTSNGLNWVFAGLRCIASVI